jgi:hypothetical protein
LGDIELDFASAQGRPQPKIGLLMSREKLSALLFAIRGR